MRLVIADTGPVNYLILIGHIELLSRLFEKIVLPSAVKTELSDAAALPPVQRWIRRDRSGRVAARGSPAD